MKECEKCGRWGKLHRHHLIYASRRNSKVRQTWKEEHLKFVPEVYRQFAVEFDDDKEY